MPSSAPDKKGWATDYYGGIFGVGIPATTENIRSVLAVAQQESNFSADAPVPGLGKLRGKRSTGARMRFMCRISWQYTALLLKSPNGKSYSERLDNVKTEKQLSAIFDDFTDMVPMGQKLFGNLNPCIPAGRCRSVSRLQSKMRKAIRIRLTARSATRCV